MGHELAVDGKTPAPHTLICTFHNYCSTYSSSSVENWFLAPVTKWKQQNNGVLDRNSCTSQDGRIKLLKRILEVPDTVNDWLVDSLLKFLAENQ